AQFCSLGPTRPCTDSGAPPPPVRERRREDVSAGGPRQDSGRNSKPGLDISFFGSSLTSAYWNGAATYYRGIIKTLSRRGHRVTFYEPDVFERQSHRDIAPPTWARVRVYSAAETSELLAALEDASASDIVVKCSGIGVFDELLEQEVLRLKRSGTLVVFWDVDAPATLARITRNPFDPFRA